MDHLNGSNDRYKIEIGETEEQGWTAIADEMNKMGGVKMWEMWKDQQEYIERIEFVSFLVNLFLSLISSGDLSAPINFHVQ